MTNFPWDWKRTHPYGYECSSKGDKRFSAFYAYLKNNKSIEFIYQTKIKGYKTIKAGKGNPPINNIPKNKLLDLYINLWEEWSKENLNLIFELYELTKEYRILTDMFATSNINQANALSVILNRNYFNLF